jgi:hypothetical protein
MYFINNINPKPAARRYELHPFPQVTDLVNPPVGSRVNFQNIQGTALVDAQAISALIARFPSLGLKAVYGFGQNLCNTGLAGSPRPAKKISVTYPTLI